MYSVCMNKSIAMFQIGEKPMAEGMNILGAGLAADDQIQGLPLDDLGGFFLHLLSRQVHQQVGYEEALDLIIGSKPIVLTREEKEEDKKEDKEKAKEAIKAGILDILKVCFTSILGLSIWAPRMFMPSAMGFSPIWNMAMDLFTIGCGI